MLRPEWFEHSSELSWAACFTNYAMAFTYMWCVLRTIKPKYYVYTHISVNLYAIYVCMITLPCENWALNADKGFAPLYAGHEPTMLLLHQSAHTVIACWVTLH